jgi:hypothetical protein
MEFELLEFESTSEYEILNSNFSNNSLFKIPVWKPIKTKPCNQVLIMINGFLEGVEMEERKRNRHIRRYNEIAQKIRKEKNIASVLLPMPFHFDRSIGSTEENNFAPINRLTENGTYLYFGGYTQIIKDVKNLISEIENKPEKYGLQENKEIKFHLLGYSLGGVAAIGSSLNLNNKLEVDDNNPKLESLIILLSAWNISEIHPEAINRNFGEKFRFTEDLWNKMLVQLNEIKDSTSLDFRKLIWDEGEPIEFKTCAKKVLFINGFKDDIFTSNHTEKSKSQVLDVMDQCTFINLPIDHYALKSREIIAGYVNVFLES